MFEKMSTSFSTHIAKPLAVAAAAVMSFLFGRRYTVNSGLQHYWKVSLPAFTKPVLAIAGFGIGAFLLAQVVSTNEVAPYSNGGNAGGSPNNSQNDASRAIVSPEDVPSVPTQSSTNTSSDSSSQTKPFKPYSSLPEGTYWDIKAPPAKQSSGLTTLQPTVTPPSASEETSPTPNTEIPLPPTDTDPSAPTPSAPTTAPNLLPTSNVTVPPASLQVQDKTLLETDSTTITIN